MALTFQFIGPKPGHLCELFHGPPYTDRELRGHIDPLQTVPVDQTLTATFTANPGNGYALRIRDGSRVYIRSNSRTLASKRRLLAIEGTNRISEAEFGLFAPPVPHKEETNTFDRLTLDFVGHDLRMFGHVFHDGKVFNARFTFDYRFRLLPVDIPVWTPVSALDEDDVPEDTMIIDTTSLKIDADRRLVEPLLGIVKPIIRRNFRRSLQKKFHESLVKQASESTLHPVITLTGTEVVDGQHVDMKIGIFGDAPG